MLLSALACEPTPRPPVWLMRQAGRYQPEFRALRARHSFTTICHTPELAAEVTMMPLKRYPLDAAILFSDILVVCERLQRPFQIVKDAGPVIENPISSIDEVPDVSAPVEEQLGYVADAIRLLKKELTVPLLGFCGGPLTVASYLIEGGTSRDHSKVKRWMYSDPATFGQLLETITTLSIEYLQMQVEAGADAVQVFETWAGLMPIPHFHQLVVPQLKRIVEAIRDVPVILFSRGGTAYSMALAQLHPAAVSVDWTVDMPLLARQLPDHVAIQGNLDPDILFGQPDVVQREVCRLLDSMQGCDGFIFNLGHGIKPGTPTENVGLLVETVREWSACGQVR